LYPQMPDSPADLVPLPLCDGPKLKPFDFKGPQKIEFIESLGQGSHSQVFKVKILGDIYALKLFRFVTPDCFYGPADWNEGEWTGDTLGTICQYSEPFYAECRAFGRLQESGHTELATDCFGYILLDDEHEQIMRDQFKDAGLALTFNGEYEADGCYDVRGENRGKDGKLPPIRGILKECGTQDKLNNKFAKKIKRDIHHLHQLGIFSIDPDIRQYVNGKIADFSTTMTTPHFVTNPELNPSLTPAMKTAMEHETFVRTVADYVDFDEMVDYWNREVEVYGMGSPKDKVTVSGYPNQIYCLLNWSKYNLRSMPHRDRAFAATDPRLYDWKSPV
ncbi:kinetochore Sim4 complex subunit FTA2-domain-containing protein, partial [Mariannaea sp. PMI_226]